MLLALHCLPMHVPYNYISKSDCLPCSHCGVIHYVPSMKARLLPLPLPLLLLPHPPSPLLPPGWSHGTAAHYQRQPQGGSLTTQQQHRQQDE